MDQNVQPISGAVSGRRRATRENRMYFNMLLHHPGISSQQSQEQGGECRAMHAAPRNYDKRHRLDTSSIRASNNPTVENKEFMQNIC
jgi:hypothetical protein